MPALRLEKKCPKCHSHLMLREGEHGDFLACPKFPACRYTEPIRNDEELKFRQPHNPYCKKCNHTGLLPFEKKGQVIPHAFLDCECRQPEMEHYRTIGPEDFDFPMSETYYGYVEERYGFGGANNRQRGLQTDGESGSIEGSTSLALLTRVEQTPAPSKHLERITQESITRSIENRRDLQEHFKLHHTLEKSQRKTYKNVL